MLRLSCCILLAITLAACSTSAPPVAKSSSKTHPQATAKTVRITHIDHAAASNELMLQSMSLIGTPYRFGGSNRNTGFDCSGMVQFVYREVLNVSLPRTAHDMAAAGKVISKNQLQVAIWCFLIPMAKNFRMWVCILVKTVLSTHQAVKVQLKSII